MPMKLKKITINRCLIWLIFNMLLIGTMVTLPNNSFAQEWGRFGRTPFIERFAQVSTYFAEKKYIEAKQEIQNILSKYGNDLDTQFYCHFGLGAIEQRLKNYPESNKEFEYVVTHALSNDSDARYYAAIATFQIGMNFKRSRQYDNATTKFYYVIEQYPDSIENSNTVGQLVDCLELMQKTSEVESILIGISKKYSSKIVKYNCLDQLSLHYIKNDMHNQALMVNQRIVDELSGEQSPNLKVIRDNALEIIPELQKKLKK